MGKRMPQSEAVEFFAEVFGGEHRIPSKLKPFGFGWSITVTGDLSTYDADGLTRLVFLAHDRAIRVEVSACNMQRLTVAVHKRRAREGSMFERHPTLAKAVDDWRKRHPNADALAGARPTEQSGTGEKP